MNDGDLETDDEIPGPEPAPAPQQPPHLHRFYHDAAGHIIGYQFSNAPDTRDGVEHADFDRIEPGVNVHTHRIEPTTKALVHLTDDELAAKGAPAIGEVRHLIAAELDGTDQRIVRAIEEGHAPPQEWVAYRKELRALSRMFPNDPASQIRAWPARPDGLDPTGIFKAQLH